MQLEITLYTQLDQTLSLIVHKTMYNCCILRIYPRDNIKPRSPCG